jgi:drug/metabolite transporter (DMT)-like permease
MTPASTSQDARAGSGISPAAVLIVGVLAASLSPILIRYAIPEGGGDAEPLAISFWRCFAGAIVLAPFAFASRPAVRERRAVGAAVIAGIFLAVHFATWITSLELTTVAASVLLVSTTPIWVALTARYLFHERLERAVWAGVILSFLGTALISGGDFEGSTLAGDGLALIGGIAAAGYVLAGQAARRTMGILDYAVFAYGVSAGLLLIACVIGDVPLLGFTAHTWWAIAAVVVGPQLLGHTLINFALKDIDATRVAISIMVEPIIATSLAIVLFDEVPPPLFYPGGIAILVGIYLASTARRPEAIVTE